MAALDFPASPTLNQTYTANGRTWTWDGTSWNSTPISNVIVSVVGTANEITATTVSGTTTLSLPSALTFTGKTITGGTFNSGAFNGTVGATTPSTVAATTINISNTNVGIAKWSGGDGLSFGGTNGTAFIINNSAGSTNALSLTSAGLGIGMTPSNVLDITQNQNASSTIKILNNSAGTGARVDMVVSNGTAQSQLTTFGTGYSGGGIFRTNGTLVYATGAGGLTLSTDTAQPIYFATNQTERARIDSAGNVGIGVTPATWYSADGYTRALQVSTTATLIGNNNTAYLTQNAYYNTGGAATYLVTGYASQYRQNNGEHAWFTAASGTAGNAISFTQAMTLDASSRLGVNTTDASTGGGQMVVSQAQDNGIVINASTSSYSSTLYLRDVVGSNSARIRFMSSNGLNFIDNSDVVKARIDGSGNLLVGGTTASYSSSGRGVINLSGSASGLLGFQIGGVAKGYVGHFDSSMQIWNEANSPILIGTNATERARIDGSGYVGIGTSSNLQPLGVGNASANTLALLRTGVAATAGNIGPSINFYLAQSATTSQTGDANIGRITASPIDGWGGYLQFFTKPTDGVPGNAVVERARIDSSGNLLVGVTTAAAEGGFTLYPQGSSGAPLLVWNRASTTNSTTAADFRNGSSSVGNITYTNTTTLFTNLSDHRRKFNVQDLTGSGVFIDALKPRTFDWDTGDKGVGFIAHEFAEVSPSSVSGEKDAVDNDGKPVYQAMQASSAEVIANLVAELQSVRQRLAALESN